MAIKQALYWHGYPNAAAVICDECGKTISEDTNPEMAEDNIPEEAIIIRRSIITPHGIKHYNRDYCSVGCQLAAE